MQEIEKLRVYSPGRAGWLLGLERVVLVSRSGTHVLQFCENGNSVIHTLLELTGRRDIPVVREGGPKRWRWAAGALLSAGAIPFIYWGHTSGRADLVRLFGAIVLGATGTGILVFRPMRSRGPSRRGEPVLGGIFLLQGCLFLYPFVDFQLWDCAGRGMRYACTRRFELARKALQKGEEAHEPASRLGYAWGILHFYEKDYARAEENLLSALATDPELNDARCQLSRTYWCMGRKEEARTLLEQYPERGGGEFTSAGTHARSLSRPTPPKTASELLLPVRPG